MDDKKLNTLECDKSSCKPIEIPSDDEVEALNALRDIKRRVRLLKEEAMARSDDKSFQEEGTRADSELLQLKKEWKKWEGKREKASRERMIALGHIRSDH